ncbi:Oxidoreductase domain protein [Candidatus Sulfobium mesophilum]|uniref:Oxidoreductase domain protein n=1 Tax=Candidatus Sulfobium mesophilum TaxID=2016548 RepID=A0A2U3QF24_9BACT|nr:Oxidoreductase domain protein [Candidatus Sulfobium mesophilum]
MKDIKVGIIGCGYWGPNLIRNFNENYQTDLRYACDLNTERLERIKLRYPHVHATTDYKELLKDKGVDAVAVATPVFTHYNLVRDTLDAGKHVLVEKPLAPTVRESEKLVSLARKKGLVLMVDHTFIYTGAIRRIKEFISAGELGEMYYFDSVRVNLGLFQHDVNVIWDLAPHDISIMDFLVNEKAVDISATGAVHTPGGMEDVAYVTVRFSGGLIAHFHVNWMSPVKIRRIIIGGARKMVVFDDLDPAEKIKIYDKGIELSNANKNSVYQSMVQYRIGDMYAPAISNKEALKVEIEHLADCIKNGKTPVTDGEAGLRVVRLLEAADKSLKRGGAKIKL